MYRQLCTINKVLPDAESFLTFATEMNVIAAQLPRPATPRAEQLALMFLFVTSPHKINLCLLPTATGKSFMFGLLSRYMNMHGMKVAVIVPNEVLAAIQ